MKRRKIAILSCVVLLLVGAFAAFEYSKSRRHVAKVLVSTPELQSVDIGSFTDRIEAKKIAIQELSRQIILHPKTSQYEAHYLDESNLDFYYSRLVYNPAWQILVWKYREAPRARVPPPYWSFVPRFPFIAKITTFSRAYGDYDFGNQKDAVVNDDDIHRAAENGWSMEDLTNEAKKFHNSGSDPRL